jgi:hypothetical protein
MFFKRTSLARYLCLVMIGCEHVKQGYIFTVFGCNGYVSDSLLLRQWKIQHLGSS